MRNWPIVLAFSLLFSCGDGALELVESPTTVQTATLEQDEVFYVHDGVGTLTLAPTAEFDHLEFHFSLADVEIRALDETGGVVTDWADVSGFTEDTDPSAYEGLIELSAPASSIELRMHTPVDFARVVVGTGDGGGHEGEVDGGEGGVSVLLARPGRWIPPPHVVEAGNRQYLPYTGAPSRCSGTFLQGTRALAEQLKNNFAGAVSYGGYNCRRNTANA